MLSATLLMLAVDDAKAALDRFSSFVRKTPVMSVDLQVQMEGYPTAGKGLLVFSKPSKAHLKVDWPQHGYEFIANGANRVEIDHAERTYFEFRGGGLVPPGEVSMTAQYAFPSYFVSGDLRSLFPQGVKFRADRKIVQGSSVLTPISASVSGITGTMKVVAYVDQAGKLASVKTDLDNDDGRRVWTVTYSNYRLGTSASTFVVAPPKGYSPDRLQTPIPGLSVDDDFPAKDWQNANSGSSLSSLRGKSYLAIYVRPGCEPSKQAVKEIEAIGSTLAKSGVQPIVLVQGAKNVAQSFATRLPRYYGATPTAVGNLRSPGTPTLYLVNRTGKLERLWYGFDREQPKQYNSDILSAAKAIK